MLHLHTLNGIAVSAQRGGPAADLAAVDLRARPSLAYHDYEGVALNEDEKPRLVRDLGDKSFLMLRNHGLLTVGETVADAFLSMYVFETACTIQVRAQAGGGELIPVPKDILESNYARVATTRQPGEGPGALAWPGLLRRLDRVDPSYRS